MITSESTTVICRLQNTVNNKSYIGIMQDIAELLKNTDSLLGSDYAIYKPSQFVLTKLETVSGKELQEKLKHYIVKYRSLFPSGYNIYLGRNRDTTEKRQKATERETKEVAEKLPSTKKYRKRLEDYGVVI